MHLLLALAALALAALALNDALVLAGSVRGADKKVLPLFKVVGGGVVELLSAIGTEHQTRKRTALARCGSPVPLLSDFLHLVKDFLLDYCRMGVVENLLISFTQSRVKQSLVECSSSQPRQPPFMYVGQAPH